MDINKILPVAVGDWKAVSPDQVFTRENIFDYMDGAGEIYLAYDFRKLTVREFVKDNDSPLVAEIYEMGLSGDAFGIFSHDTDGEPVAIGQDALYGAGLLRFWKGRFFIRVLAEKETRETRKTVFEASRKIAAAILQEGQKPKIIVRLPPEGLLQKSAHYFHKQVSLNALQYLGDENFLNLSEKTEAVLAQFKEDGQKMRALVCRYQNIQEAERAFMTTAAKYLSVPSPAKDKMIFKKTREGRFASALQAGQFIILAFDADSQKICEVITKRIENNIKEAS